MMLGTLNATTLEPPRNGELLERRSLTGYTVPIGTVRIRNHNGNDVRMIKVRDSGPIAGRWIHYARWWWEKHRGRVPAGKRVVHVDGDSLNDDPTNYAVGNLGDSLAIWHENNPRKSERNYEKLREATRRHNRLRGEINRARNVIAGQWYGVDLEQRIIHQGPARKRWQIWARVGMPADVARSRYAEGAALGWQGVGPTGACILSVLADSGEWMTRSELQRATADFAAARRWSIFERTTSLYHFVWQLRGAVIVRRRGSRPALYHIAPSALATRTPASPVTPLRGADLRDERFADYERRGFLTRSVEPSELVIPDRQGP